VREHTLKLKASLLKRLQVQRLWMLITGEIMIQPQATTLADAKVVDYRYHNR
jgi:hypothetical protein